MTNRTEELLSIGLEIGNFNRPQELLYRHITGSNENKLIRVSSEITPNVVRLLVAQANLTRELHPPKVLRIAHVIPRIQSILSGNREKDNKSGLITIDAGEIADHRNPHIWMDGIANLAIEKFADIYGVKPEIYNRAFAIPTAKQQLARWTEIVGVTKQALIYTNLDSLSAERQILTAHTLLRELADSRRMTAYLLHEEDVSVMGKVAGIPENIGAPGLNEGRWSVVDLAHVSSANR